MNKLKKYIFGVANVRVAIVRKKGVADVTKRGVADVTKKGVANVRMAYVPTPIEKYLKVPKHAKCALFGV